MTQLPKWHEMARTPKKAICIAIITLKKGK